MSYQSEYERSVEDVEGFWKQKAQQLEWYKFPQNILSEDEHGIHHWFADGKMNTCYMAVDVHVKNGRGDQAALIYDSPVTGRKQTYSYSDLLKQVSQCAGMLQDLGVTKGDRVIIYMPMVPEAAIAMLACARLGAIHSVVFGGFAPSELSKRIDDATPKVIMAAVCGVEVKRVIAYKPLLDAAIDMSAHKPQHCVILQRPEVTEFDNESSEIDARDIDWMSTQEKSKAVDCVEVNGSDPLYILYTSGTTGKPKGVVRENGGHAVAMQYSMKAIYDMDPGDVFWAASDVGWVVGHSYIIYAPLLQGCTTVMYEGKPIMTPDAGAFWRVIEEYKVKALFTAPTAFRAIKKDDPNGAFLKQYDLSSLITIFSAGERLDPPTYDWLCEVSQRPVIDHWWQTETGWAIAANMVGIEKLPVKSGSATVPVPGFNVQILDDNGHQVEAGVQGNIAIKLPLPPSCLATIWNNLEQFKSGYLDTYPGFYVSGDGGYLDDDGYLFVMGRVDDVINVSGHRLSTGEMEEIVGRHQDVAECAVFGRNDNLKGQMPVGLVVLKNGASIADDELCKQLVGLVRGTIGAVACFKEVYVVEKLPKTRSGKILRKTIRQIFNAEEYVVPSTIDDPESLPIIEALVKKLNV